MIFKDMLEVPGLQQFISRCETEEWGKELQKTLKLLKMDPNAGLYHTFISNNSIATLSDRKRPDIFSRGCRTGAG